MRESLQKLVAMFRRGKALASGRRAGEGGSQPAFWSNASTGETVFHDRPLRMRQLTVPEPETEEAGIDVSPAPAAFKIRISKLYRSRTESRRLVRRRYIWRGYQLSKLRSDQSLTTFIAYDEGELVGTVSVRLDSRRGLAAEDLYPSEVGDLRARGLRLCEFTRLAVDKTAASKPVLAGLFHTAYLYASVIQGSTHAIIEVNPRHVRFYAHSLGFEVIGPQRHNQRVDAPAVLLGVSFASIASGLARFAGKPDAEGAERSLFPFCFPADEEAGVLRRLHKVVAGSGG